MFSFVRRAEGALALERRAGPSRPSRTDRTRTLRRAFVREQLLDPAVTVLTSAAIWSSLSPSAGASCSTALPFGMPHDRCPLRRRLVVRVDRLLAQKLDQALDLLEAGRSASWRSTPSELVAELTEPLVEEPELPRVERAG